MMNLDSILQSRDISLPTEACKIKAMVFPVVLYVGEQERRTLSTGGVDSELRGFLALRLPSSGAAGRIGAC